MKRLGEDRANVSKPAMVAALLTSRLIHQVRA
jgi:hypothetical protein